MTAINKPHLTLIEALQDRGYQYEELQIDGNNYKEFIAPNGWRWFTSKGYYYYPFVSVNAFKISRDKSLSNAFVEQLGIPIPYTLQTSDITLAQKFLEKHSKIIVKPLSRSGSKGLTLDIENNEQLSVAMEHASSPQSPPLIQKQFFGEEVRLTVLNGKVQSVILRETPRVIGDGISTVRELIILENQKREKLIFPTLSYPLLDETIIDGELMNSEQIVDKDEVLELSKATMIKNGASFCGITESIHHSYCDIAERLALYLNPSMIVVDLMLQDHTIPATNENYVFLEFNTSPSTRVYSCLRSGDKPNIVDQLADMLDEHSKLLDK